MSKISGPLLDRIDLHIDVAEVKYRELTKAPDGEKSSAVAARVREARAIQLQRYKAKQQSIFCNAQIGPAELERHCQLDTETKELLGNAVRKLGFSARAYDRVLKVGRTIADLEGSDPHPLPPHLGGRPVPLVGQELLGAYVANRAGHQTGRPMSLRLCLAAGPVD